MGQIEQMKNSDASASFTIAYGDIEPGTFFRVEGGFGGIFFYDGEYSYMVLSDGSVSKGWGINNEFSPGCIVEVLSQSRLGIKEMPPVCQSMAMA